MDFLGGKEVLHRGRDFLLGSSQMLQPFFPPLRDHIIVERPSGWLLEERIVRVNATLWKVRLSHDYRLLFLVPLFKLLSRQLVKLSCQETMPEVITSYGRSHVSVLQNTSLKLAEADILIIW